MWGPSAKPEKLTSNVSRVPLRGAAPARARRARNRVSAETPESSRRWTLASRETRRWQPEASPTAFRIRFPAIARAVREGRSQTSSGRKARELAERLRVFRAQSLETSAGSSVSRLWETLRVLTLTSWVHNSSGSFSNPNSSSSTVTKELGLRPPTSTKVTGGPGHWRSFQSSRTCNCPASLPQPVLCDTKASRHMALCLSNSPHARALAARSRQAAQTASTPAASATPSTSPESCRAPSKASRTSSSSSSSPA
mmetsp:Transcript_37554/g.112126  ORF Transcript_37554/g.112126 Transcript_37554/m.112126 type:complete len:254 (-) Transcript_37554:104-865(-)